MESDLYCPWDSLHPDILNLFLNRLSFADHIAFGGVCPSWRSATKSHSLYKSLQYPFLVLPQDPPFDDWVFFSIVETQVHHHLLLHVPPGGRYFGSSFGWLMMADEDLDNHLVNPFTGRLFRLPPSVLRDIYLFNVRLVRCHRYPRKAILSSIPSDDNVAAGNCVVVAIDTQQDLAFCRPGDNEWTVFGGSFFNDIIFVNGLLYCLVTGQVITVYEFSPEPVCRGSHFVQPLLGADPESDGNTRYLVESEGELLMVVRYWVLVDFPLDDDDKDNFKICFARTIRFRVYRLDPDGPRWKQVRDLGKRMLLVGTGYSKSFTAEGSRIIGNSIYYTDDRFDHLMYENNDLRPRYDWGIFRMEDQSIHPFLMDGYRSFNCPPFWYMLNA